ncbi:MAG TPA: hypothetical protein VH088_16245 [Terriglobales bacterium]|nr:hypothetical protein [Terriglobales bacterium]
MKHRLTAGSLLTMLLVSIFTPAAMATSGPAPHACCLRRMHHGDSSNPSFNTTNKQHGNCCPPSVTPHCAEMASPPNDKAPNSSSPAQASPHPRPFTWDIISDISVRGPPNT